MSKSSWPPALSERSASKGLTARRARGHGGGVDSLRVRLMLLAALALLPLAGLVLYHAVTERRAAATGAEGDALQLAHVYATNEERIVDSAQRLLALLADFPAVKSLDAPACGPLLARVLGNEAGYSNLGLLDARGGVVASAKPVSPRQPAGDREFLREALAGRPFVVSDFELDANRDARLRCGVPVRGEKGEVVGVIFAEMDLAWIADLNARLALPGMMTIGVISGQGTILMRLPEPEKFVGKSVRDAAAGRTILKQGGSGTSEGEGLDHVRRLFAFTPLDPLHGLGDFVSAGIPDEIAFSGARRSERRQLALLAAFALAAMGAAWLAAEILVLRGVRMLLSATQRLGLGDLSTRAGAVYGGGEFRELAAAFDAMAASLEKQARERENAAQELERRVEARTAEIEEANRKLQSEIAERGRIEAELRRSNAELEQFAYIASHDLQEPLRMVASYTQLLERRYAAKLDDTAREFIAYAVGGAKRMQQFITGLLRYSRVGTEPSLHAEVNLPEVVEAALANLRIAIEESGAAIEAGELPAVMGDARQLTQLFQNLIGNAIKFRKPGEPPRIEVRAEREGNFRRLSVRDNGIGLDPQFSERVFVIFQRLHTRDEYEGTGLGLAICKKIVELHGGRIWVESREGEGATFFFTLPAPAVQTNETVPG